MNNDLISREALKKALKKYKYCGFYDKVIEIIDNAPTVEERPQGEWYRTGQSFINPNKFRNYGCSVCRYELDEHIREKPNFCPNCGAKMKGGAE